MKNPDFPEPPAGRRLAYVWFDAACVKIWLGGRIMSVAVSIAIGVSPDGQCEPHGLECRIWPDFSD